MRQVITFAMIIFCIFTLYFIVDSSGAKHTFEAIIGLFKKLLSGIRTTPPDNPRSPRPWKNKPLTDTETVAQDNRVTVIGKEAKSGTKVSITVLSGGRSIFSRAVYVDNSPLLIGRGATIMPGYDSKLCLPDNAAIPHTSRAQLYLKTENGNLYLYDLKGNSIINEKAVGESALILSPGAEYDVEIGDFSLILMPIINSTSRPTIAQRSDACTELPTKRYILKRRIQQWQTQK